MPTTETALDRITTSPTTHAIYATLIQKIDAMGAFDVEPNATSLHIVRGRAFLGVHPRKDALLLNIVLDRPLDGPRVAKCEQVSKNRYHNEVRVASPQDIDRELVTWVKEAYRLTEA